MDPTLKDSVPLSRKTTSTQSQTSDSNELTDSQMISSTELTDSMIMVHSPMVEAFISRLKPVLSSSLRPIEDRLNEIETTVQSLKHASQDVNTEFQIPPSLQIKIDQLKPSHEIYNKYVVEHGKELKPGTWISIVPGQPPVTYSTYEEAAEDNQCVSNWFCKEYSGHPPMAFASTTADYQRNGQPSDLPIIRVKITNPMDEKKSEEIDAILDTGATDSIANLPLLNARLDLGAIETNVKLAALGNTIQAVSFKAVMALNGLDPRPTRILGLLKSGDITPVIGQSVLSKYNHYHDNTTMASRHVRILDRNDYFKAEEPGPDIREDHYPEPKK